MAGVASWSDHGPIMPDAIMVTGTCMLGRTVRAHVRETKRWDDETRSNAFYFLLLGERGHEKRFCSLSPLASAMATWIRSDQIGP